jgi:WD40 repeat protein
VQSWSGHEKDVTKVIYCHRIDKYVSGSRDKSVKVWQPTSTGSTKQNKCLLNMVGHDMVVTALTASPDNSHLISGSRDNRLCLWDLQTGQLLSSVNISRNLVGLRSIKAFSSLFMILNLNDTRLRTLVGQPTRNSWFKVAKTKRCESGIR